MFFREPNNDLGFGDWGAKGGIKLEVVGVDGNEIGRCFVSGGG